MDTLISIWNYTLFSVSDEIQITFVEALTVTLFVLVALKSGDSGPLARMPRARLTPIRKVIQTLFYWVFLVLVLITALGMLQIPITHLAFVGGAIAVGVGFGAQNIINNLISSWILMSEKPVRIGDFVEIDQHAGVVERIGNRSTRIRRIDGACFHNSQMLERGGELTLADDRFRSSVGLRPAHRGMRTR
jgi:small-conductance mechanosensitive channel